MSIIVHLLEVVVSKLVLLLKGVESSGGLMWLEDPSHSDVTLEVDPDQVPSLLLVPVRTNPYVLDGVDWGFPSFRNWDAYLDF